MRGGDTFETIIRTMDELGYSVEWQVLNSRTFGIPQNRERVFIVGHFGGFGGGTIFPITEDNRSIDESKRFGNNRMISNTLQSGDRRSIGVYPLDGGGLLKVNGFHKKDDI